MTQPTPDAVKLAEKVILEHLPPHQAERFWPSAAKDLARAYLGLVSKVEAFCEPGPHHARTKLSEEAERRLAALRACLPPKDGAA